MIKILCLVSSKKNRCGSVVTTVASTSQKTKVLVTKKLMFNRHCGFNYQKFYDAKDANCGYLKQHNFGFGRLGYGLSACSPSPNVNRIRTELYQIEIEFSFNLNQFPWFKIKFIANQTEPGEKVKLHITVVFKYTHFHKITCYWYNNLLISSYVIMGKWAK